LSLLAALCVGLLRLGASGMTHNGWGSAKRARRYGWQAALEVAALLAAAR
jgi:hypothetical protein